MTNGAAAGDLELRRGECGQDGPGGRVPGEEDAAEVAMDAGMPLRPLRVTAAAVDRPDGTQFVAHWTWADGVLDGSAVDALARAWFRALTAPVHAAG